MPIKVFLVLLSQPNPSIIHEPLGIECLGGYLKSKYKKNIVLVYDHCHSHDDINKTRQKIHDFQPDILGVSLFFNSLSLLDKLIKSRHPYTLILGNVLATFNSNLLLQKYPKAIVCQGSGEEAMRLLVEREMNHLVDLQDVPNIVYRQNNKICQNPHQKSPIGKPDRFLHKNKLPIDISYLEFSRGCEYNCTFCLQRRFFNHGRTCKPMSSVIQEIVELVKLGTNRLYFIDEDFIGPYPQRAAIFANKIIELKNKGIIPKKLTLDFPVSVKSIYSENETRTVRAQRLSALKILRSAGWNKCFIGLESGSKTQLKRYGKPHTIGESVRALKILRKLKIDFQIGFIMFDPLVTLDEIRDNVKFCFHQLIVNSIGYPLHQLRVYPQSAIYHLMAQHGLIRESDYDPDWLSVGCSYLHHDSFRLLSAIKQFDNDLVIAHYMAKNVARSVSLVTTPVACQQYFTSFLQDVNQVYFESLQLLLKLFQQDKNANPDTRMAHTNIADCLTSLLIQGDQLHTVWRYSPNLRSTLVKLIFKKRIIGSKNQKSFTADTLFHQKFGLPFDDVHHLVDSFVQSGEIRLSQNKYYLTDKFFAESFNIPDDKPPVYVHSSKHEQLS